MKERIIWNSEINLEDWKEFLEEENCTNESDAYYLCNEMNSSYLEDEELNLNVETKGRIIAIANLGLWNGRKSGYKILGNNVKEILFFTGCNEQKWFFDGHNVKFTGAHHDGINYIEFREIRENRNIENLLDAIYSGKEISRKMLNYYTRSLKKYVKQVYGW